MKIGHVFTSLLLGILLDGSNAARLNDTRPNIVFILADDLGMGDLACMGNPDVQTPNIDALYAKSTRLTDFHVSPTCSPSRAAFMTGLHEFKVGVTHTIEPRYNMLKSETTIAEALRDKGYSTGIFNKWHLGEKPEFDPAARGFDYVALLTSPHGQHYFNPEFKINGKKTQQQGYFSDVTFDLAENWIGEQVRKDRPFFAWIADKMPHEPYVALEPEADVYLKKGFSRDVAHRYAMIHILDRNVGKLLEKLKTLGIEDRTLIVFTSDNGQGGYEKPQPKNEAPWKPFMAGLRGGNLNFDAPVGAKLKPNPNFSGGKLSPYEGGTRVPFFARWKGHLPEGKDIDALTAHLDIYSTLSDLAGIPADKQKPTDGFSLVPLFEGKPSPSFDDRLLFIHSGRWPMGKSPDGYEYRNCAVRSPRFRLVNNGELYDISKDPGEKQNVIDQFPDEVDRMRKAYDQWWAAVRPKMINDLP
jgi:arylsulfatase